MNDRIYTLATRAWMDDRGFNRDPIIPREFIDRFAELIVKECIDKLQERYMGDLNREDMEVKRCIEDIQKHFGVNE